MTTNLPVEILQRTNIALDELVENEFQEELYGAEEEPVSLARSMQEDGLIEAILVWADPSAPERFEIVSGHRRARSARMLGWTEIRADVAAYIPDRERRLAILIAANAQTRVRTNAQLVNQVRMVGGFSLVEYEGDTEDTSTDAVSEPPGGLASIRPPQTTRSALAALLGISLDTVDRIRFVYDDEVMLSSLMTIAEPGLSVARSAWDDVRWDCRCGLGFREGQKRIQKVLDEARSARPVKRRQVDKEKKRDRTSICRIVEPGQYTFLYQKSVPTVGASFGLAEAGIEKSFIFDYQGKQYVFDEVRLMTALIRLIPKTG